MNEPIEIDRVESIRVVGLAIRTTNRAEQEPSTAQIPALWMRFMQEQWPDRLEHLGAVGPTMAVYLDYASDMNGEYRLVVGRELPRQLPVPLGLEAADIPPGPYLEFSRKGGLPEVVTEGWQRVWAFFAQSEARPRAYAVDFELYPVDGSGVDIFVGVR